jgi:hypothetical protein
MEIMTRGKIRPRPLAAAEFYQVLGRVMTAIKDAQLLSGIALDWWPSGLKGRGEWHIEWVTGPFPHEVAAALTQQATADPDEGSPALRYRMGDFPEFRSNGEHRAVLVVDGIPVHLRALEPIGEEMYRRGLIEQWRAAQLGRLAASVQVLDDACATAHR